MSSEHFFQKGTFLVVSAFSSIQGSHTPLPLLKNNSTWIWNDNSPLSYTNWYNGVAPSLTKNGCVTIEPGLNGTWKGMGEEDCERVEMGVVCEFTYGSN